MCQYATIVDKVCKNLKYVSIKFAKVDLQKCITWQKESDKGCQEWNIVCIESSLRPRKLITPMKTRLVWFLNI